MLRGKEREKMNLLRCITHGVIVISIPPMILLFLGYAAKSKGTKEMQEISDAISDGAMVSLNR